MRKPIPTYMSRHNRIHIHTPRTNDMRKETCTWKKWQLFTHSYGYIFKRYHFISNFFSVPYTHVTFTLCSIGPARGELLVFQARMGELIRVIISNEIRPSTVENCTTMKTLFSVTPIPQFEKWPMLCWTSPISWSVFHNMQLIFAFMSLSIYYFLFNLIIQIFIFIPVRYKYIIS